MTSPATSPRASKSPTEPHSMGERQHSGNSSYTGEILNVYFNGKSAISDALRRDSKLRGHVPAFVLGRSHSDTPEHVTQWVNVNVKHIHYFSYRNRLPVPLSNGMDYDAGWGCMIRTGQMMLCEALRRCLPEQEVWRIPSLFYDTPAAPFGLHSMTQMGTRSHIPVGQWFSPTAVAFTIKRLVAEYPLTAATLGVVVAQDGAIRRREISAYLSDGKFVLLLIPIMAGRERVPPETQRAILKTFELERTLGIVGGRPRQSLYFVGSQGDALFYLDPHTVQPAFVSPETVGNASGVRGTLNVADLDPSMLLCFLLTRIRDLEEWEQAFHTTINPLMEYPLFSISGDEPSKRYAKPTADAPRTPDDKMDADSPTGNDHLEGSPIDDCAYDSSVEQPDESEAYSGDLRGEVATC